MGIKVSKLIDILSNYEEEYIDFNSLKRLIFPKIRDIEYIMVSINMARFKRTTCSKAEFARLTKKSRVTINEWIDRGVVIMIGSNIDLNATYNNMKIVRFII